MQSLWQNRDSKRSIDFRDDLSEYSCPSNWGDRPGPLSLSDHRIVPEGLQARRTVGEALVQAKWEKCLDERAEVCAGKCSCMGARAAKVFIDAFRRMPSQPSLIFAWSDVQSIILLPYEERGPYLICVATCRPRDGTREWVLQAGNPRGRARWAIEMMTGVLRDRCRSSPIDCCPASGLLGREVGLSLSLFMDMARIACEVARHRPSAEGLERLIEALDLLAEGQKHPGFDGLNDPRPGVIGFAATAEAALLPAPHFPLVPLRRFGDAARRAAADFAEWRRWREVSLLLRNPPGWDPDFWQANILPFLWPQDPSLRDPRSKVYPPAVDQTLSNAADRWRKTLS